MVYYQEYQNKSMGLNLNFTFHNQNVENRTESNELHNRYSEDNQNK